MTIRQSRQINRYRATMTITLPYWHHNHQLPYCAGKVHFTNNHIDTIVASSPAKC